MLVSFVKHGASNKLACFIIYLSRRMQILLREDLRRMLLRRASLQISPREKPVYVKPFNFVCPTALCDRPSDRHKRQVFVPRVRKGNASCLRRCACKTATGSLFIFRSINSNHLFVTLQFVLFAVLPELTVYYSVQNADVRRTTLSLFLFSFLST